MVSFRRFDFILSTNKGSCYTGGISPHSDDKTLKSILTSHSFPLPSNQLQEIMHHFLFRRKKDSCMADLIKKWRSGVSNTTYTHIKHIAHVRFGAAIRNAHCSSSRRSQSPAGPESRSDESFRWISSGALLVWGKAAMGGSQGSRYGRREAQSIMSLMGAPFMYTGRLPLPAFQGPCLLLPVWREETWKREGCVLCVCTLCVFMLDRGGVCEWLHVWLFSIIAHNWDEIQKVDEKRERG